MAAKALLPATLALVAVSATAVTADETTAPLAARATVTVALGA
jgi:hypothetical protein